MNKPSSVLVIDDESMMRLTISAYLEDSGFHVFEATDGREGVEQFMRHRPDIVLTDLRMPGMDGMEVIAAIKAHSPTTPIIVITGTGDTLAQNDSFSLGACNCLFKPFNDLCLLEDAITQALRDAGSGTEGTP